MPADLAKDAVPLDPVVFHALNCIEPTRAIHYARKVGVTREIAQVWFFMGKSEKRVLVAGGLGVPLNL